MSIIKIAAVCLVAVALSVIVKQVKPELGIFIPITASAVVFIYALSELSGITEQISIKVTQYGLNNEYLIILFKSIGIAYVTEFAADCCKDAGESAIASKVELYGKVMILACAVPIMFSVLEMIDEVISLI